MTVTTFCAVTGIPRATWYRWRAASSSSMGPWSTPAQDTVEADAKALAAAWEGWGHRKLAALKRVGVDDIAPGSVSDSTMYRVLARNGLCLPANYTAAVRRGAPRGVPFAAREAEPAVAGRRLRIRDRRWGRWNLGGVVDYWAKVNLACAVTVRTTTSDAIPVFEAALAEVEALLGVSWVEDLTDPATGQIATLRLVTDNGPCFTSARFGAWVASKRHIAHIRTRRRAPWTNGVVERFFEAIKYEHLYRRDIANGPELADQIATYRTIYNTIRPHEAIAMTRPLQRYQQTPTTQPPDPENLSITRHGTHA